MFPPRWTGWLRWSVLLALGLPLVVMGAGSVVATLPATCLPATAFTVSFAVTPAPGTVVQAVEEQLPPGWTATGFSHGGAWDAGQGKLKWGPFFDGAARVLTCSLTAPAQAAGEVSFAGEGSFDGAAVAIEGVRRITVLNPTVTSDVVCESVANFLPGTPLPVTLRVRPAAGVMVYSVEDQLPAGWSADQLNEGGSWDGAQRKVKWGPYFDATPRTLSFRLLPPPGAATAVSLAGTGSFDGRPVAITGQRTWTPAASSITATLPATFEPGVPLPVSLAVSPAPGIQAYSVEDRLPPGWTASSVSAGGVFDVVSRAVKWGPFYTNAGQTLTYSALPPAAPEPLAEFAGVGSFNGGFVVITGQRITALVASRVVRQLPANFLAGVLFTVTNRAFPAPRVGVYAVEDTVPAGWTVTGINEGGAFDAAQRKVKWGPFFDAVPRVLTYQLLPPANAAGTVEFSGTGSFDGQPVAIAGDGSVSGLPVPLANRVERIAPAQVRAGLSVWITNRVSAAPNVSVYAVEELPVAGWTVAEVPLGSWDASLGKIKWGPFFDHEARDLAYRVVVPTNAAGFHELRGVASFDGAAVAITGADLIEVVRALTVPLMVVSVERLSPDIVDVTFRGQPGVTFTIQSKDDIDPLVPWQVRGTRVADPAGDFVFRDSQASAPVRFYRVRGP